MKTARKKARKKVRRRPGGKGRKTRPATGRRVRKRARTSRAPARKRAARRTARRSGKTARARRKTARASRRKTARASRRKTARAARRKTARSRAAVARRRRRPVRLHRPWLRWPDHRLLGVKLCDLDVKIEGTWLERCVRDLRREVTRRDLRFQPHVWVSYDWFSPDNVPGIAIPFYLTHERLMKLERSQMLEVEGGTYDECMKILRHEYGHAIQHAYRLHRRSQWRRLFGSAAKRYPDVYRPNPASRRYVQHLRLYYAQSHPVEDFAETFAVWLQPRAVWRRRYAGWPALRKLEYVDRLMREIGGTTALVRTRKQVEPLREIRKTLRQHYKEKRAQYSHSYPDIYDRDLRRLFSDRPRDRHHKRASQFLRRNRAEIRKQVSRWTGEYQFTLDQVLSDMIGRCRQLKLRVVGSESALRTDFALLLTVKTMHFLYSRKNWIAL